MRKMLALMAALAVTPVIISAIVQVKPPQGRGRGLGQDEAPIRVRDGSVLVDTLMATQWVADGPSRWSQDRASSGTASPIAEVHYVSGKPCRVQGAVITITYNSAKKNFKVLRAAGKLKVEPKADFTLVGSSNGTTIASTTGDSVTEVSASGGGSSSCKVPPKTLVRICIATTQTGLDSCQ